VALSSVTGALLSFAIPTPLHSTTETNVSVTSIHSAESAPTGPHCSEPNTPDVDEAITTAVLAGPHDAVGTEFDVPDRQQCHRPDESPKENDVAPRKRYLLLMGTIAALRVITASPTASPSCVHSIVEMLLSLFSIHLADFPLAEPHTDPNPVDFAEIQTAVEATPLHSAIGAAPLLADRQHKWLPIDGGSFESRAGCTARLTLSTCVLPTCVSAAEHSIVHR
jgi:hypothetical protein